VPIPAAFHSVAGVALNGQLQRVLERPDVDPAAVQALLREADLNHVKLDQTTLEFTMRKRLEAQADAFEQKPEDFEVLKRLHALLDVSGLLPFHVGLGKVQETSFARLVHANGNGKGSALANAAAAGAEAQGATPGATQPANGTQQDWGRELAAVREKLHIRGPE
jgi:hypothetical protein